MTDISNKIKKFLATKNSDPEINIKKNKIIDLYKYFNSNQNQLFDFLNFKNNELQIKINSQLSNDIIEELNCINDSKEFNDKLNELDLLSTKYEKITNESFEKNKNKIINEIKKNTNLESQRFLKIQLKANETQSTHNIETLYLGALIFSGNLDKEKQFNAPLICYPINIDFNENKIKITRTDEPCINKKLLKLINDTYSTNFNFDKYINYENELDNKEINILNVFNNINEEIESSYITNFLSNDFAFNKISFLEKNEQYQLSIKNCCIISQMQPIGGKMKEDIETIAANCDPFVPNLNLNESMEKVYDEIIENDKLYEVGRGLNIYQKYAVQSSLIQNTLIYGPPGTGKSETIACIIANAIANNKTILMSSEKQAAIDVLYNRLGKLRDFSLFIFQSNDKQRFYDCITKLFNNLTLSNFVNYDLNNNLIYNNLKNKIKEIENIYEKSNKYSISKYKISEILKSYNEDEFNKLLNDGYFSDLKTILENHKNIIHFDELLKLSKDLKLLHLYHPIFDELLNKTNFNLFDNEKIKEILKLDLNEQNILNNILIKNELQIKKSKFSILNLFKNKDEKQSFDSKKYQDLFINLSNIEKLNKFSKTEILILLNNELDKYEMYFYLYLFLDSLQKQKYQSSTSLDEIFKDYIENKEKIAQFNIDYIYSILITRLQHTFSKCTKEEKEQIIRASKYSLNKRQPSINKFIKNNYLILRKFFPIWILSPSNTCVLIPLEKNVFDYGIYDEASQMFVENAFPLVYRCITNIVAGDDKQMPPSNWFSGSSDESDEDDLDKEICESLLDKANFCNWPKFILKNHYRSQHDSLIRFSNDEIYNNELEFSSKNGVINSAITVYNVNGTWNKNYNLEEIEKVIEIIKNPEFNNKKIVVVTFNKIQSEYIEKEFTNRYLGMEIYERLKNKQIIIRNLENIQGDEGDILIISVAYGKNLDGKVHQFFGPLSYDSGPNRLNVAITRAKEKMIVVKSINSSDINVNNPNTLVFKKFIEFVDRVQFENLPINENSSSNNLIFDSSFEEEVYEYLEPKLDCEKYKIITQYPVGKKRIDLAIMDNSTKKIVLGIEVDGYRYHHGVKKTLEDLDRQKFLSDLGYQIYRILEIDWLHSKEIVCQKILKWITSNNLLSLKN